MNPISGNTVQVINLDQNDAAMSIALAKFPHIEPSSTFYLVGVAKDYQLSPRTVGGGSIHVYRIVHGGQGLELIHRTAVDEVPYAICPFQNKVLIGKFVFLHLLKSLSLKTYFRSWKITEAL